MKWITVAFLVLKTAILGIGQEEERDYNTCVERCDESYFPGRPCYCNSACTQYENCCYDYISLCQPELATQDTWSDFQGHSYKYFAEGQSNAREAQELCRHHGAMLVSINSQEEFDYVTEEVLRKRTLSAFIGGTDVADEGVWVWADGTLMALPTDPWHAWFDGEPDNHDNAEHCSAISNYMFWAIRKQIIDSYVWRDYSCDFNPANEIQGYICERTLQCENITCENGGSCVYIPGPQEFECVCQKPYVGDRCQYEEREGEIWTICGETNLTETEGVISSPLYPKPYPSNVRCRWFITSHPNRTLSISIDHLDIEASKDCMLDYLIAYDGTDANASVLFGPLCGGVSANTDLRESHVTSSSEILVEFHTDKDVSMNGFSLSYSQARCGQGSGDSGCGTPQLYTLACGDIAINHVTTDRQVPCTWLITIEIGRQINLTVTQFQSRDTGANCEAGALTIYDGPSDSAMALGRLCGWWAPMSFLSSSNAFFLKMENMEIRQGESVHFKYETLELGVEANDLTVVHGMSGSVKIDTTSLPVISYDNAGVYEWLFQVPYGYHMIVRWNASESIKSNIKIYMGLESSQQSLLTGANAPASSGYIEIKYFQALVQVSCPSMDDGCLFSAEFQALEWLPHESGCFRPQFHDSITSKATENNLVTSYNPIMLMVSDDSYNSRLPGYGNGLYCKWRVQTEGVAGLVIDMIDVNIHPKSTGCRHDGFVIVYNQSSFIGPFCGAESLKEKEIKVAETDVTIVFYSDPSNGWRHSGVLRALVRMQTQDNAMCPIWEMIEQKLTTNADCGIVMSPNFPGLVHPGIWFWIFTPPKGSFSYYTVHIHYVRGPGINDNECDESFKVIEIPNDAVELRQYESNILTLCGTTTLFEPTSLIRLPPKQKLGIELNTLSNSLPKQWQFKLSFKTEQLTPPVYYPETGGCPEEYTEWRGYCYRYYYWVLRHYEPDEYTFQTTWQNALAQCEAENATLLTVYDDEEAYFIKNQMATTWFWDEAAPFIINHRLVFLGLHNKQHKYQWTTGVSLGFSDWYKPQPKWAQSTVHEDSFLPSIVNLENKQPTADSASLCTGFIPVSPTGSMNWVKIPCDYPLFRAGVICKKPVQSYERNEINATNVSTKEESIPHFYYDTSQRHLGCIKGSFLVDKMCYNMYTQYQYSNTSSDVTTAPLSIDEAMQQCAALEADIPNGSFLAVIDVSKLSRYLKIWNHTEQTGNILLGVNMSICHYLLVEDGSEQDKSAIYTSISLPCDNTATTFSNVICGSKPQVYQEECGANEFQCDNKMCISADYVCDSANDCKDNSDERHCECGLYEFECDNGDCVSISLRCDFIVHCMDGTDEENCVLENCDDTMFRCDNGQCINGSGMCDRVFHCIDQSDEAPQLCSGKCDAFQCYSGLCLDMSLSNDGMTDCPGLGAEDEADQSTELSTLFGVYHEGIQENVNNIHGCRESGTYVNCHQEESPCFDRAETCIYDTVKVDEPRDYSVMASCRDGTHLKKSCDSIECPGMYHCFESYCIPLRKMCDSHIDCPNADDEINCEQNVCPGLLRCKDTDACVPHSEVCDGVTHCPVHGEDEKYCGQVDIMCDVCMCHGHIAYCDDANITSLPQPSDSQTRTLRAIFLSMNKIRAVGTRVFSGLAWLTRLVLSDNKIEDIRENLFIDLVNLLHLDLSNNRISHLKANAFKGLGHLKVLNLNHNELGTIKATELKWLTSLRHLRVENNDLDNVEKGTFDQLVQLKELNAHAYKICCVAKHVQECTPEADEFSSCEDLMANYTLQISIWILGFVAVTGNAFVVIWRLKTDRKKSSSFFIINLGCSDFLMGVYLLIIASVDVRYRGNYIVHADAWRQSWLCQLAGVLATLSSEVSVFMLTTITIERCLTLIFPLKFGHMSLKSARFVAFMGWFLCGVLSLVPLSKAEAFGDAYYGRTGVCLPFVVSSQRLPGWQYSVFVFLVLNLISFIIIFIGYIAIFLSVKSNMDSVGAKSTSRADEYALAKKLALIVGSDFVCWVPIIMIGLAALGGASIAPQVSAWIAVFILPLNSAINPVLYTISAIDCGRAKKRRQALYTSSGSRSGTASTNVTVSKVSTGKTAHAPSLPIIGQVTEASESENTKM